MKNIHCVWLAFILSIVLSCDCPIQVSGIVVDNATGLPIDSVAIGKTDSTDLNNPFNDKIYTDSNGDFSFNGIAGKCDFVLLYFSKNGYKTSAIKFENFSTDTIRLNKN